MLDCCRPLDYIKVNGITLSEFDCLARCNGLDTRVKRVNEATKGEFINDLKRTSEVSTELLVVSYHRGTLQQTGDGHFSPVAGFNEVEGMVLILDVARFKYPSYWVSVDLLWESLHPVDKTSNKPRTTGNLSKRAISQLSVNQDSWGSLKNILFSSITKLSCKIQSVEDFISFVLNCIPNEYASVVFGRHELLDDRFENSFLSDVQKLALDIEATDIYKLISTNESIRAKMNLLRKENDQIRENENKQMCRQREFEKLTDSSEYYSRISKLFSVEQNQSKPSIETKKLDFMSYSTLFLYALLGIRPFVEQLVSKINSNFSNLDDHNCQCCEMSIESDQIANLAELEYSRVSDLVKNEVLFLRDQIVMLSAEN
ncbi:hypothetical protein HK096_004727 [Nowakowskiella sp. JEL0078]|nr:hypothetical protein HK096_004727 [Nowakowskiella sp. JEL0078]